MINSAYCKAEIVHERLRHYLQFARMGPQRHNSLFGPKQLPHDLKQIAKQLLQFTDMLLADTELYMNYQLLKINEPLDTRYDAYDDVQSQLLDSALHLTKAFVQSSSERSLYNLLRNIQNELAITPQNTLPAPLMTLAAA